MLLRAAWGRDVEIPRRRVRPGPLCQGIPPRWSKFNERTVCCRLREREDRADPRDDYRTRIMLVRLRVLRERVLRSLRRPRPLLVRCLGGTRGGARAEL